MHLQPRVEYIKNDPIHDSLGKINPDFNQERIVFGAYALVYTCTINGINTRSIPPIALNDSDNHIGDYFIRLYTGKRLHSYEWTELPIDKKIIEQVKQLSSDEKGCLNGI